MGVWFLVKILLPRAGSCWWSLGGCGANWDRMAARYSLGFVTARVWVDCGIHAKYAVGCGWFSVGWGVCLLLLQLGSWWCTRGQAMKNIEDIVTHHGSGSMNLVVLHLDCLFKCNRFLFCC